MSQTVAQAAVAALLTPAPQDKRKAVRGLERRWRRGELAHRFDCAMPDQPAWPAEPVLLPPRAMPRRRSGGAAGGRIAMLHALAHIEFVAMDLAVDMAGRFGDAFPRAFTDDWLAVAADEAMHFALLNRRLEQLGSHYGALPAHGGLWEAAAATSDDALARLAIVPMVLEARALDITPQTIGRFEDAGDLPSASLLTRIMQDEIRHVAAGTKWFSWACAERHLTPAAHWQSLVKSRFRGALKPPFNDSARHQAGLTQDFYANVARPAA